MKLFDTHAHYEDAQYAEDREELLESMHKSGVEKIVNIGAGIEESKASIELAKKYPNYIYATCGIHPENLPETKEELETMLEELEAMAKQKEVVAIGEIGLDYHYNKENKEFQKYAFLRQIEIANKLELPISLHTRDAIEDTIAIIRTHSLKKHGILHCCPFNKELVKQGLEHGYYIAFGGVSTFKNAKNAEEIVNMVPNERILIETDAPYLAPEPLRGTRNDSRNLSHILQKLSTYRNQNVDNLAEITYQNALTIYQIENK